MMCPNNPSLPRWLCTEPDCETAELKSRGPQHHTIADTPTIETNQTFNEWSDDMKKDLLPDWPIEKKHPMITIKGITYMLEYDGIFYGVASSWQMNNGDPKYKVAQ